MSKSTMKLLSPFTVGDVPVANRVFMAPMTRSRAGADNVVAPVTATYYAQRASAGLLITEGTQVSQEGVGYPATPGVHTDAQVAGWRVITDAVHAAGGKIFAQLWHVGRMSLPSFQPDGGLPVAPSALADQSQAYTATGPVPYGVPRALETAEIARVVSDFAQGARNAKAAGFDGVELHGANGYLIDQFLRDGSNQRTDQYGGSIANRVRFLGEILDAIVPIWGAGRVGLRLSLPVSRPGLTDSDPAALVAVIAQRAEQLKLAYLHMIQPVAGMMFSAGQPQLAPVIRQHYHGTLILNGGYTADTAEAALQAGTADAIAFGVPFLANPDLPARLVSHAPLNAPQFDKFYGGGVEGYTDYPTLA